MKPEPSKCEELRALLERWCEGEHEKSLAEKISSLLRDDPELVWEYLCHMEMHASLRYQQQEGAGVLSSKASDAEKGQSPDRPLVVLPVSDEKSAKDTSTGPSLSTNWPWMVAVGLGLMGMILTAFLFMMFPRRPGELPVTDVSTETAQIVARLTSTFDCEWDNTVDTLQPGSALRKGETLALAGGFARIAFETGAVLTLQAPARVVLNHPNGVLLHNGVVTSEVPERARGFTVETASSRIVDFGTEFGVAVDEAGATALSVFRGVVEIAGRHHDALPARRVTAGQAIRFDHIGEMLEWREVDPSRFAPGCRNAAGEPDPNALPVHVRRFRHAEDLSFPNKVVAAINVGGSESLELAGVRFEEDHGDYITSPCEVECWSTRPWFGERSDDILLSRLLFSIRHNLTRSANGQDQSELSQPIRVVLPVEKGRYRVSLLLCENHHARAPTRDRSLNIDIEGRCCVRDLRILAVQGIAGYPVPPNQAIVLSTEVDITDGTLDVLLFSRYVAEDVDENVILNALVVERLD